MANFNDKSRTAYNAKADDYDNTTDGRFTREFKRLLADAVDLNDAISVLDVACGNGSLLKLLNKKKPIKGYGIDISENMIRNAKIKNPGMEFYAAGCEAIPFPDNTFDIATVCAAYHHFPHIKTFAKEAWRVLKYNGRLYIADVYLPAFLRVLINPFVPLSKDGDVKFYSPEQITDNFAAAGFVKLDVKIYGHIQIVSLRKL